MNPGHTSIEAQEAEYEAARKELADAPAWPMFPVAALAPVKFDALHCSDDNRVRVATIGGTYFVSIDGDNFTGPFRTAEQAHAFGDRARAAS